MKLRRRQGQGEGMEETTTTKGGLETRMRFEPQVCFFLVSFIFCCTNNILQTYSTLQNGNGNPNNDDTAVTTITTQLPHHTTTNDERPA